MPLPTAEELAGLKKADLLQAALELLEAAKAPAAVPDDVFVMYMGTGAIPGGFVSRGFVQRNPPSEALARVAHVRISARDYTRADESYRVTW